MRTRIIFALVAMGLLCCRTGGALAADPCAYDLQAMLALDEPAFDQDLSNGGGGWRGIGNVPGCELAAADLIAAYRARHGSTSSILLWHEGQLRASGGQAARAIPLLQGARKDTAADLAGWNHYVDATIAFLRGNREALVQARERLAAVEYPAGAGMPPLVDGYVEVPTQAGQPSMRMRWPPNLDVVDGLLACFGKPYGEAYGPGCRSP